jgi:hypothetical protein
VAVDVIAPVIVNVLVLGNATVSVGVVVLVSVDVIVRPSRCELELFPVSLWSRWFRPPLLEHCQLDSISPHLRRACAAAAHPHHPDDREVDGQREQPRRGPTHIRRLDRSPRARVARRRRGRALDAARSPSEHGGRMATFRFLSIPLLLLMTAPVGASPDGGAAAVPPAPVRSADAIIADAVKATGGDAPWKSHRSMETTTVIDYAKMAITGTRIQTITSHNKSLAITNIPNVGEVREGTNGRVIWSEDPVNGLRLLSGAEAAQFKIESTWNLERNLKKLFAKIAVRGDSEGGRPLECLELTPSVGQPLTTCYDAETHLQVSQKGVAATPQGDVPFTSRIKSWKEFSGLKLPELVEMTTGPIEFSARLTGVVFDKPVDDKRFEVPGGKDKNKAREKTKESAREKTTPADATPQK